MKRIENFLALVVVSVFAVIGFTTVRQPEVSPNIETNNPEIFFLNVGQGDATLIQDENYQVLVDGGPGEEILTELGKVMPVTDRYIEVVVLTHPHADHLRGLNYVLASYKIGIIYFSGVSADTANFHQFLALIKEKGITTKKLYRGEGFANKEFKYQVLWPPKAVENVGNINDTSVVLDVQYHAARVLLLGDVSTEAQSNFSDLLRPIDVLKVSHHGSKTGTDEELVQRTRPEYAVFEVGKNSYGHPAPSVLSLLRSSKILRTDRLGTIGFALNKDGVLLY